MADDEHRAPERAGPTVDRRRFLAAVGGASVPGLRADRSAAAAPGASRSPPFADDADSAHFAEATLEFGLRDETITPARRSGPRPYTAALDERRLLAHDALERSARRALLDADAVVFGLESFRPAPAVFARRTEDALPVAGSATPHRTRFLRLDGWSGAPTYRVETAGDGAVAVRVAGQSVALPSGDAATVRLDDRVVPADRVPGYDRADGLTVTPRLEVRNYGRLDVRDATDRDRHNA